MKEYFTSLFKYNDWANQRLLICLQKNKFENTKIIQLYSHIIAAQVIWLKRILGESDEGIPLWDPFPINELVEMTHESSNDWINFIEGYMVNTYEEVIAYKSTNGKAYETRLIDIIIHVANHSTYHRAQITSLLKAEGIEPPVSDYIFYCREGV